MNSRFKAFPKKTIGGYLAYVRFSRDGEPKPIRNDDGNPALYENEILAYRAIIDEISAHFAGGIRGEGVGINKFKQQAEAVFRKDG